MAVKSKRVQHNEVLPNCSGWLTTFNDLITLLMVFFVMLFSMGNLDSRRFENFRNGLQSAMGVLYEGRNASSGVISDQPRPAEEVAPESVSPQDQTAHLQILARTQGLEAEYSAKGLHLTLNDELLFTSGSARLTDEGLRLLANVSAVIQPLRRTIRIEGHTDDRPIATPRYPSNWELSTARAVSVVNFLIHQGAIPEASLSAAGYGSSKPLVSNDSERNRGLNRRVEIILGPEQPSENGTRSTEGE